MIDGVWNTLAPAGMPSVWVLLGALLAGVVLGAGFFGGLWWTVRHGTTSQHPVRWFMGSLVLRVGVVIAGFWWIGAGEMWRLVACCVGFWLARLGVFRFTRLRVQGADLGRAEAVPPRASEAKPKGEPCV